MQVEVFQNDSHVNIDRPCSFSFEAKTFLPREKKILEFEFRLDPQQICRQLSEVALGFRRPTLDLHFVLSRLKRHHPNTVARN